MTDPRTREVLKECVRDLIDDVPRLIHVASWRHDEQGSNCERVAREQMRKALVICDLIRSAA